MGMALFRACRASLASVLRAASATIQLPSTDSTTARLLASSVGASLVVFLAPNLPKIRLQDALGSRQQPHLLAMIWLSEFAGQQSPSLNKISLFFLFFYLVCTRYETEFLQFIDILQICAF